METIVYGSVHGAALLADIARPAAGGELPVALSIHGGRWYFGTRRDTGAIDVRQWAGFGFFAMSIDYRLVTCSPAPAAYQDVLCAIRWVHANADRYGLDRDRIFLIGMSSGGHLASLAATLGEGRFPRTGGWDEYPARFRAAICVSGAYDIVSLDWGAGWAPPGRAIPGCARIRLAHPPCRARQRAAAHPPFRRRPLDPDRAGAAHDRRAGSGPARHTASAATPIAAICSSPTR